jgi:hypothetical protein
LAGERPWALISLGVVVILCALSYSAYLARLLAAGEVLPAAITLAGVWVLLLAAIRAVSPSTYSMSPFSTAAWGILILALGAIWFLNVRGFPTENMIVVFGILIGLLIVVIGLRERGGW